ncbi:Mg-chelatase subunit ChlD [Caldalkalibacillus uzonensis]|uniref:Mg-chelatase subunit ChlD n=1 Tax=Caldalkalibacillus uzonensis TaxID=353224 RepID=A0ABU0CM03_9BACI|nr:VWA domain-containing protein [Caldalkalibacillus uzonensis]MDQ0337451.1 Mg-chelatase subunit ChlD [Caldalkalibacillus uzonensis]
MAISVHSALYLLLFIPVLLLLTWWWKTQTRVQGPKKYMILLTRLVLFTLLISVLSGLHVLFPVSGETVVFVVDRSASMPNEERIFTFLQEAVDNKQEEDQFAIVSVGQEAVIEQPLTNRQELAPLGAVINPHATNLAEGVRLASGLIGSQDRGKIVLVTDGLETHGDVTQEIQWAKERGIVVEAMYLQQDIEEEVLLSALHLPDRLHLNETFTVTVEAESTVTTKGTLRLYERSSLVAEQEVDIDHGINRFAFQLKAGGEGFQRYRAELEAEQDTIAANNQAFAFTQVGGKPRILVLEGHQGAAHNVVQILQAGDYETEVRLASQIPQQLEDLKQYATLILADVEARSLTPADMERIRTAVRDLGIGLVKTGGSNSFGLGGWFSTPIEEALPVDMDLKSKEKLPSLALSLVIDKSGSMQDGFAGLTRMELAKEGAVRATEMLSEKDQIGVVAFDSAPWEVVEMQQATDLATVQDQIRSIYADGGTDIFAALEYAFHTIKDTLTQRKHIILLTDGHSGRDDDYVGLLAAMKELGITVSTVAVGADADIQLLEQIAEAGGGRHYFVTDPESLPRVFTTETALANRTFIVEKTHIPLQTGGFDWASLSGDVPSLAAYIAATPKQTAEVVLTSTDGDPVLSRWQYGLGRAVAWTSDWEGQWAPQWVNWTGLPSFWNELVQWTLPQATPGGWTIETKVEGLTAKITVSLPSDRAMPGELEAVVIDDSLKRQAVPLKPVAPGQLQAAFDASETGTYLIHILQREGEHIVASETAGLSVSYSPEYRLFDHGEQQLRTWVEAADGRLIASGEEVFRGDLPLKWESQDISTFLLILAAILWPIDIALRRLHFSLHLVEKLGTKLRRKPEATWHAPVSNSSARPANISAPLISRGGLAKAEQNPMTSKGTQPAAEQSQSASAESDPFTRLLEAKKKIRRR